MSVSVARGRCGPCCSVAPTGTASSEVAARAATSGEVSSPSRTDHARRLEGAERGAVAGPPPRVDVGGSEGAVGGRVVGERLHEGDEIGGAEERQAAVAVVVRERAERLRAERDLRIELVGPVAVDQYTPHMPSMETSSTNSSSTTSSSSLSAVSTSGTERRYSP